MNEQASSWLSAVEGLQDVHQRLKSVVILNDNACKVIGQQDGPHTLFYCDPPYLHETRTVTSAYGHEMTESDHLQLAEDPPPTLPQFASKCARRAAAFSVN